MKSKQLIIQENELVDFIYNNFKEGSLVEISYNRVFIPGVLLYMDKTDNLILTLQLKGELLCQTVDINIDEIKREIIEINYSDDKQNMILTII